MAILALRPVALAGVTQGQEAHHDPRVEGRVENGRSHEPRIDGPRGGRGARRAVQEVPAASRATVPTAGPVDAGLLAPAVDSPLDAGVVVRFLAVGDTGKGNPEQHQVGAAMGALCAAKGCDFVVLLGDNFYPSGVTSTTDPQWQTAFVQPYATVDAPFYVVLGNHDYGGKGQGQEFGKEQAQLDYAQVNPKWRLPARHYRWSLGPAEFFAADTNRSMYAGKWPGVDDEQVRHDFAQWLPASTATWKIAFGHHPYYSNGPHGNAGHYDGVGLIPIANGEGVKDFLEATVCGKADVYLSGHDHSQQWLTPRCGSTELIVSGAGSSPTTLPGKNASYFQSLRLGFLWVELRERTFTGIFYDETGAEEFRRVLTK